MVRTTFEIMDKSEPTIKQLGLITSRFALLEEMILGCIHILVGGECASILTAKLSFSNSLTILGAVFRQKNMLGEKDESPENLNNLLIKAQEAEEVRNKMVHSMWKNTNIQDVLIRTKPKVDRKKGLKLEAELITAKDLNDVADKIQKAIELALEFTHELLMKHLLTLVSPLDGATTGINPNFKWLTVEGAVGYVLFISEKPDFSHLDLTVNEFDIIKDTTYTCKKALKKDNVYYWKVQPIIGTEDGYWSEIRSFKTR